MTEPLRPQFCRSLQWSGGTQGLWTNWVWSLGEEGATPTLTSHLSPRQAPKHLSGHTDGWAWNGLVCRQGEAQQLLNRPASDPGQSLQGRKHRRIECPLSATHKGSGRRNSLPL